MRNTYPGEHRDSIYLCNAPALPHGNSGALLLACDTSLWSSNGLDAQGLSNARLDLSIRRLHAGHSRRRWQLKLAKHLRATPFYDISYPSTSSREAYAFRPSHLWFDFNSLISAESPEAALKHAGCTFEEWGYNRYLTQPVENGVIHVLLPPEKRRVIRAIALHDALGILLFVLDDKLYAVSARLENPLPVAVLLNGWVSKDGPVCINVSNNTVYVHWECTKGVIEVFTITTKDHYSVEESGNDGLRLVQGPPITIDAELLTKHTFADVCCSLHSGNSEGHVIPEATADDRSWQFEPTGKVQFQKCKSFEICMQHKVALNLVINGECVFQSRSQKLYITPDHDVGIPMVFSDFITARFEVVGDGVTVTINEKPYTCTHTNMESISIDSCAGGFTQRINIDGDDFSPYPHNKSMESVLPAGLTLRHTQDGVANTGTRPKNAYPLRTGFQFEFSDRFGTRVLSSQGELLAVRLPYQCATFDQKRQTKWYFDKDGILHWERRLEYFAPSSPKIFAVEYTLMMAKKCLLDKTCDKFNLAFQDLLRKELQSQASEGAITHALVALINLVPRVGHWEFPEGILDVLFQHVSESAHAGLARLCEERLCFSDAPALLAKCLEGTVSNWHVVLPVILRQVLGKNNPGDLLPVDLLFALLAKVLQMRSLNCVDLAFADCAVALAESILSYSSESFTHVGALIKRAFELHKSYVESCWTVLDAAFNPLLLLVKPLMFYIIDSALPIEEKSSILIGVVKEVRQIIDGWTDCSALDRGVGEGLLVRFSSFERSEVQIPKGLCEGEDGWLSGCASIPSKCRPLLPHAQFDILYPSDGESSHISQERLALADLYSVASWAFVSCWRSVRETAESASDAIDEVERFTKLHPVARHLVAERQLMDVSECSFEALIECIEESSLSEEHRGLMKEDTANEEMWWRLCRNEKCHGILPWGTLNATIEHFMKAACIALFHHLDHTPHIDRSENAVLSIDDNTLLIYRRIAQHWLTYVQLRQQEKLGTLFQAVRLLVNCGAVAVAKNNEQAVSTRSFSVSKWRGISIMLNDRPIAPTSASALKTTLSRWTNHCTLDTEILDFLIDTTTSFHNAKLFATGLHRLTGLAHEQQQKKLTSEFFNKSLQAFIGIVGNGGRASSCVDLTTITSLLWVTQNSCPELTIEKFEPGTILSAVCQRRYPTARTALYPATIALTAEAVSQLYQSVNKKITSGAKEQGRKFDNWVKACTLLYIVTANNELRTIGAHVLPRVCLGVFAESGSTLRHNGRVNTASGEELLCAVNEPVGPSRFTAFLSYDNFSVQTVTTDLYHGSSDVATVKPDHSLHAEKIVADRFVRWGVGREFLVDIYDEISNRAIENGMKIEGIQHHTISAGDLSLATDETRSIVSLALLSCFRKEANEIQQMFGLEGPNYATYVCRELLTHLDTSRKSDDILRSLLVLTLVKPRDWGSAFWVEVEENAGREGAESFVEMLILSYNRLITRDGKVLLKIDGSNNCVCISCGDKSDFDGSIIPLPDWKDAVGISVNHPVPKFVQALLQKGTDDGWVFLRACCDGSPDDPWAVVNCEAVLLSSSLKRLLSGYLGGDSEVDLTMRHSSETYMQADDDPAFSADPMEYLHGANPAMKEYETMNVRSELLKPDSLARLLHQLAKCSPAVWVASLQRVHEVDGIPIGVLVRCMSQIIGNSCDADWFGPIEALAKAYDEPRNGMGLKRERESPNTLTSFPSVFLWGLALLTLGERESVSVQFIHLEEGFTLLEGKPLSPDGIIVADASIELFRSQGGVVGKPETGCVVPYCHDRTVLRASVPCRAVRLQVVQQKGKRCHGTALILHALYRVVDGECDTPVLRELRSYLHRESCVRLIWNKFMAFDGRTSCLRHMVETLNLMVKRSMVPSWSMLASIWDGSFGADASMDIFKLRLYAAASRSAAEGSEDALQLIAKLKGVENTIELFLIGEFLAQRTVSSYRPGGLIRTSSLDSDAGEDVKIFLIDRELDCKRKWTLTVNKGYVLGIGGSTFNTTEYIPNSVRISDMKEGQPITICPWEDNPFGGFTPECENDNWKSEYLIAFVVSGDEWPRIRSDPTEELCERIIPQDRYDNPPLEFAECITDKAKFTCKRQKCSISNMTEYDEALKEVTNVVRGIDAGNKTLLCLVSAPPFKRSLERQMAANHKLQRSLEAVKEVGETMNDTFWRLWEVIRRFNVAYLNLFEDFGKALPDVAQELGQFTIELPKVDCGTMSFRSSILEVDRAAVKEYRSRTLKDQQSHLDEYEKQSLFGQYHKAMMAPKAGKPKVKYVGEAGEDAGGVFRDFLSELCAEVFSPNSLLFVPTPNTEFDAGQHRGCFHPRHSCNTVSYHLMYESLGALMAMAAIEKDTMPLKLSPLVYKVIAGGSIQFSDMSLVDERGVAALEALSRMELSDDMTEEMFDELFARPFTVTMMDGSEREVCPGGSDMVLSWRNRVEFVELAKRAVVEDGTDQIRSIKRGFERYRRQAGPELEPAYIPWEAIKIQLCGPDVCGGGQISGYLQFENQEDDDSNSDGENTNEERKEEKNPTLKMKKGWFIEIVSDLTTEESKAFLRFTTGCETLSGSLIVEFTDDDVDTRLPISHTCSRTIEIPAASTIEIMKKNLLTAILNSDTMALY